MEKKEHEFCLRCGRKLKNPQTRKLGYGQICYQKLESGWLDPLFQTNFDKVKERDELKGREKSAL